LSRGALLTLVLSVVLGGAGGALLAFGMRKESSAREGPPRPPPEAEVGGRGADLATLRDPGAGLAAQVVVSPREHEEIAADAPEAFEVRCGGGDYAAIRPWLEGLAPLPGVAEGANRLLVEVAFDLDEQWRALRSIARGPVGIPPVRVFLRRHPRPDLAGRCVSIAVTFTTCADPALDGGDGDGALPRRVRGILLEAHRTYQLEGGPPRLVAATLEAQTQIELFPDADPVGRRRSLADHLPGDPLGALGRDARAQAPFRRLAGGVRRGLAWFDRSLGLGAPDPWSAAYRILGAGEAAEAAVHERLPDDVVAALLALVARA